MKFSPLNLFFISILTFTGASNASDSVDVIKNLKVVEGFAEFTQSKKLKFLKKPIVSTGHMILSNGKVIWQVIKPVEAKTKIVGNQVFEFDSKKERYNLLVDQNGVESIMQSLLAGEISDKDWQIEKQAQENCVGLTPKDTILAKIFTKAKICVSENIDERMVTLVDGQGNLTDIQIKFKRYQLTETELNEINGN